jgi:hypothetical protein
MTDTNDMLPSRLVRAVRLLQVFVLRFFDKNPLSQVQIILTSDGLAAPLTPLSGALSLLSLCPQQLLKPRPGNEASNIATIELRGVQLAIFFPPPLVADFHFFALLFFSSGSADSHVSALRRLLQGDDLSDTSSQLQPGTEAQDYRKHLLKGRMSLQNSLITALKSLSSDAGLLHQVPPPSV